MWDTGAAGDYSALNSEDTDSQEEHDESEGEEFCTDPQEQSQNEPLHKSFHFLEECSFIDFVDTNGEFVITAGRDHDMKVWDAATEVVIRRFIGHTAPITGIKLQGADPSEPCSAELTVISSSEDGSIREWSLRKGTEIRKIETENVITCMGIMSNKLVAIGNHKGHLDVHHLSTGQLYCSIVAHNDPIDALMVNDVHICTAVYDRPGSLRVWQLKWGKVICMYSLEEIFSIEFATFTMYGDLLILGDGTEQKLHILSYMTEDTTDTLQLCETAGHVQHVAVMDGLVLASTVDNNKMVHLHVYQLQDFDHLGTFYCKNMDRISAITLIKNQALKFILGGSALAVLKLETSTRKDSSSIDSSSKSPKEKDMNLTNTQENLDENNIQSPENVSSEEEGVDKAAKCQISKSNASHPHQKQPSFDNFSHLPPILKSKELKVQQKKGDMKCKHPDSEYYWTEKAHLNNLRKQGGILPHLNFKTNFQQNTNSESTASKDELNKSDLDQSMDQGDIQQSNEPTQEKLQKSDFKEQHLPQHDKDFVGETNGNNGTDEHLPQRIPRTLTQKQKYESEKVRIIKINKEQGSGKKHNWFNFTKKKQQKCADKEQQKKSKEKDCKIM